MSDDPVTSCQTCGKSPVEKLLYPVAVHFKGSGFYTTDYGRGSRKRDSAKDGAGDGSGPSSSESSSNEKSGSDDKKAKAAD